MERNGLSQFITDYIEGRKQPKLEAHDKDAEKKLAEISDPEEKAALQQKLFRLRQEIEKKYEVRTWLTEAASRAWQISLVTHAIKYFHGDAKGSSIYSTAEHPQASHLSTSSLKTPAVDAVGNSAVLDVAKLLQTEHEGDSLLASLQRGDHSALAQLAENEQQLALWVSGFTQALSDKSLSSHKLAKQIYFPIGDNDNYHLLSPLYSSSLAHALYQRINTSRYSETSVDIRKARREQQWVPDTLSIFADVAIQGIGGTKPQNISYLNSARGGKSYLLRCAPPEWHSTLKPPVEQKTIFGPTLGQLAGGSIHQLRSYLVSVVKEENTMLIRQQRAERVDDIIGIVFSYAAEIQNLTDQQGWSARAECQLKVSQQLWLDPLRQEQDLSFKLQREDTDSWQKEIAGDFGHWLHTRLNRDEKLNIGAMEIRELASVLLRRRLFEFDACRQEVTP